MEILPGDNIAVLNNGLAPIFAGVARSLDTETMEIVAMLPSGFEIRFAIRRLTAEGSARQAAADLGARGGRARSPRKAAAVRENGKKGGRPRKG